MSGRSGAKIFATVFAAAIGAGFGNIPYQALAESLIDLKNWLYLAVVAVIMLLAARHFFDPLSRLLRTLIGIPAESAADQPSGRGLWAMSAASLVSLVWLERVFENYVMNHWLAVSLALGTSVLVVGGVTLGWALGAGSRWRLSALLGALIGFVTNGLLIFAAIYVASRGAIPLQQLAEASFWSGVSFAIVALAGGLAIDFGAGLARPSLWAGGIAFAAMLLTGALGVYLGTTNMAGVMPNLFLAGGWLLGLLSSPYSDGTLSRTPRVAASPLPAG